MADTLFLDSARPAPADAAIATDGQSLAPFGSYRLPAWREHIRAFGAGLVPRKYPRLASVLAYPIWRLALLGRRDPVDLQPFEGFSVRLYPRQNHADSKCFARAALCDLPEEAAIARCAATTSDARFVMVDVGANTGTYTLLAASLAAQAGKTPLHVCIEANPKTLARLRTNLHFCGLDAQARIFPVAVSDAPGTVMLDTATWNLGSVKVTPTANRLKKHKVVSVPARPLAAIVEDAGLDRIDFLKIDIEGHEVPALGPFLRTAPPHLLPRMILAETKHDKGGALRAVITGAGYTVSHEGRSDTVFELPT